MIAGRHRHPFVGGLVAMLTMAACSCGPSNVPPERAVLRLDLGLQFSCATWDDGSAACWGRGNRGMLGYGEMMDEHLGDDELVSSWGMIPAGGEVLRPAIGVAASCLGYIDGSVRCWGVAGNGSIGSGSTVDAFELPEQRPPLLLEDRIVDIAGYSGRTCGVYETDAIQCWGYNENGVLGYGNTNNVGDDEPLSALGVVPVGAPVASLAMGYLHTCALLEGGDVKCWGLNTLGQLGQANEETIGDDEHPESAGFVTLL